MQWWHARNEQKEKQKLSDSSRFFFPLSDDHWSLASDRDDFGSLQARPSASSLLAHLC